jgi:choline kinase
MTQDLPKNMLKLGKETIAQRQIIALNKLGFDNILMVTGYRTELLEEHLSSFEIEYMINTEWAVTNNIYSLYMAKEITKAGFYLFNGDVVFDFEILNDFVTTDGTAMVIDKVKDLGDEEMKVSIKDETIIDISKTIPLSEASGEYIGLMRFEKPESELLFAELEKFISRNERGVWYENAIKNILGDLKIKPVYTKNNKWIEVDNINDYNLMMDLFG